MSSIFERGNFGQAPELIVIPPEGYIHTVESPFLRSLIRKELSTAEVPLDVMFQGFFDLALIDLQLQEQRRQLLLLDTSKNTAYPYSCLDEKFTPRLEGYVEPSQYTSSPYQMGLDTLSRNAMDRFSNQHDMQLSDLLNRAISFGLDYAPRERAGFLAGWLEDGGFASRPLYNPM